MIHTPILIHVSPRVGNGDSAKRWFLSRLFDFFCTGFHDGIAPCTFHVGDSIQGPPGTFLEVCSTSTPPPPLAESPSHQRWSRLALHYPNEGKSSLSINTQEWTVQTCHVLGEHPPIYDTAPNFLFGRSDLLQMTLTDLYEMSVFSFLF